MKFDTIDLTQAETIKALAAKHGLKEVSERLVSNARNCISMAGLADDDYHALGNCRLGGLPDMPEGLRWPNDMSFLAQLDMSRIGPLDPQKLLPQSGMLYFFMGSDEEPSNVPVGVIYAESAAAELRHVDAPDGFNNVKSTEYNGGDVNVIYDPFMLTTAKSISLPGYGSKEYDSLWENGAALSNAYFALADELHIQRPTLRTGLHQMLGHSLAPDGSPEALACANRLGIDPDLFWLDLGRAESLIAELESPTRQPRNPSLANYEKHLLQERRRQRDELARLGDGISAICAEATDWILLLQLDSDLNAGMCFWDAGMIQFLIHRDDIARRRFDQVFSRLFTS